VYKAIPKEEQENLFTWFNEKDYSFINHITIEEYLVEIEERLELYQFSQLCGGDISDSRWEKLTPSSRIVVNFNNNNKINKPLNKKVSAQLGVNERTTSWGLETESVVLIKGDDLQLLLQRKELEYAVAKPLESESASDEQGCTFPEKTFQGQFQFFIEQSKSSTAYIPLRSGENIQDYVEKTQTALSQKQYLFPFQKDKKQVLFSLDLESSNDELLKQIAAILPNLREKIGLPEPIKKEGYQSQLKSLRTFIDYKAIEYLDILLYCSMESPRIEQWKVSDALLCDLLFHDDESPDGERVKKIRTRFYKPKLLNPDYITDLFTNIRSERSDIQLPTDYLFISK